MGVQAGECKGDSVLQVSGGVFLAEHLEKPQSRSTQEQCTD